MRHRIYAGNKRRWFLVLPNALLINIKMAQKQHETRNHGVGTVNMNAQSTAIASDNRTPNTKEKREIS